MIIKNQALYVDKIGKDNNYNDIAWAILCGMPELDNCNIDVVTNYLEQLFHKEMAPVSVYLDNSLIQVQLKISIVDAVHSGAYNLLIEAIYYGNTR